MVDYSYSTDKFVDEYDAFVKWFTIENDLCFCPNNNLSDGTLPIFRRESDGTFINTSFLSNQLIAYVNRFYSLCYTRRIGYRCCVNFKNLRVISTEVEKFKRKSSKFINYVFCNETNTYTLHICHAFPIMIGSEFDLQCCGITRNELDLMSPPDNSMENFFNSFMTPLQKILRGYFINNGDICLIPFLVDNNREEFHYYDDKNNNETFFRFFLYNNKNRGFLFSHMQKKNAFCFIDKSGQSSINQDIKENQLSFKKEFHINDVYMLRNYQWIHHILKEYNNLKIKIDDLTNKVILHPCDLIYKLMLRIQKNPQQGLALLNSGQFNKLISITTQYKVSDIKTNLNTVRPVDNSNLYRYLTVNQKTNPEHFYTAIKMTQDQIRVQKKILDNFYGFVCSYDFTTNIKSFGKSFNLIPDLKFTSIEAIFNFSNIFNELLDENLIKVIDDVTKVTSIKHHLLIRYLPTQFQLRENVSFLEFFHRVKKFSNFIEVRKYKNFINLSCTLGTCFKPFPHKNFALSPYEYQHYKHILLDDSEMIRSSMGIVAQILKSNQNYESIERSIISAGYFKSKLMATNKSALFTLSNEVSASMLFDDATKPLPFFECNKININPIKLLDNYHFKLRVCFLGNPTINEDTIVLDKRLNFNIQQAKRYNYELEIGMDCEIIFPDKDKSLLCVYNNYNRLEEIIFIIATIYSKHNIANLNYGKVSCKKIDKNVYLLYKSVQDSDILRIDPKTIEYEFDVIHFKKKINFFLEIILTLRYRVPYYDGLKLANLSGQKGLTVFKDLSCYKSADGQRHPDVMMSIYSVLSREPLPQLQEMFRDSETEPIFLNGKQIGYMGYSDFFILRNNANDFSISGLIKIDNLLSNCLVMNNLNSCLYTKIQDNLHPIERYKAFPKASLELLNLYEVTKHKINIDELNDNDEGFLKNLIKIRKQLTAIREYEECKFTNGFIDKIKKLLL